MTLRIAGQTQKSNLRPIKLLKKVAGRAISTESASEADPSDQLSQIKLAIKKMTNRVYDSQ